MLKLFYLGSEYHMQVHPSGNHTPAVISPPKLYKPTFYSSHLSCNMPYNDAATIWIFCLSWWNTSI